jgi:hypothetical protein
MQFYFLLTSFLFQFQLKCSYSLWKEIKDIQDPRLKDTVLRMNDIVLHSKSENTYKKYRTYFFLQFKEALWVKSMFSFHLI